MQLKKMCKEGAYWGKCHCLCLFILKMRNRLKNSFNDPTGTVAGVYVGMEYGAERIRGTRDWVEFLTTIENTSFLLSLLLD